MTDAGPDAKFAHDGELPGGEGVWVGVRSVRVANLLPALRHNLRHLIAGQPLPVGADPARTKLNEVLAGVQSPDDGERAVMDDLALHGLKPAARKDAAILAEVVFGAPPELGSRHGEYLRECVALLTTLTPARLISAAIHRDQGAPHVHCLLLPIVAGAWMGSRLIDKKAANELRAKVYEVAARYGVRKVTRLTGDLKRQAAFQVLAWMEQSPARECPTWPAIRAAVERDPAPFMPLCGIDLDGLRRKARLTATMTGTGRRTREDSESRRAMPAPRDRSAAVPEVERLPVESSDFKCSPSGATSTQDAVDQAATAIEVVMPAPTQLQLKSAGSLSAPELALPPAERAPPAALIPAPRCPPMTPALRAELDLPAAPANPSPEYRAYMRFHEWRRQQAALKRQAAHH